jgi:uncharacterized protein DUF4232
MARKSVVALLVSIAVLLTITSQVAPAAPARSASPPKCATSGLVMWLNSEDSGTAGRQIGSPAGREVTQRPRTVTLAPEAQTTALIRVVDVGALPASCRPVTAAGFRVYPPGQTTSKVVPFPFRTCSAAGQSSISVRAVKTE